MIRYLLFLVLVATTLNAQGYATSVSPYDFSFYPRTLSGLTNRLERERGGAVIALAQDKMGARTRLTEILCDEGLLPYSLRSIAEAHSDAFGKEICEQQGWEGTGPRWVFVDFCGQIIANGNGLPTPEEILRAIDMAGVRPRLEILKQFTRQNPEHLTACVELLIELCRIGEIRTYKSLKLGLPNLFKGNSTLIFPGAQIDINTNFTELPEDLLLSDSEDTEIWEDYVRSFNAIMPKLLPFQSLRHSLISLIPDSLAFSPLLQRAANSFSPKVEDALLAEPSNTNLWKLWIALKPGRSIVDLLDTLVPGPFTSESDWLPHAAKVAWIAHCRRIKDWNKLFELAEPIWDVVASAISGPDARQFTFVVSFFVHSTWMELMEPLVDALLGLNRIADAEQILEMWSQHSKWDGAFQRAAKIARQHGFETLSERWEKMRLKADISTNLP